MKELYELGREGKRGQEYPGEVFNHFVKCLEPS